MEKEVLIIGNGFDLSFDLKTSYRDFVASECFQSVSRYNALCKHLYNQSKLVNWFDVEQELATYSKSYLDPYRPEYENFEKEFKELNDCLVSYLKEIEQMPPKPTNEYIEDLVTNVKLEEVIILDFNYTSTFRKLATGLTYIEKNHFKIHGSLEEKIIFGVADKSNIRKEHIFLKKAYNRHYRPCRVMEYLREATAVTVVGYSFGEMDHTYFQDFFLRQALDGASSKEIMITYYGEESYRNIMMQIDKMTNSNLTGLKQRNDFYMVDLMP